MRLLFFFFSFNQEFGPSVLLIINQFIYLFIYLYVCPASRSVSAHPLSLSLSVSLSLSPSLSFLSVCVSVCLSVCVSLCLSLFLSLCRLTTLSISVGLLFLPYLYSISSKLPLRFIKLAFNLSFPHLYM